jgi:hypothetical protein
MNDEFVPPQYLSYFAAFEVKILRKSSKKVFPQKKMNVNFSISI